jgi:hypothetical protein
MNNVKYVTGVNVSRNNTTVWYGDMMSMKATYRKLHAGLFYEKQRDVLC